MLESKIKIEPRPYQVKALDKIYSDLQVMPEVLLSGVMGSGKTFMSCRLIQRLRTENPGMTFLILAHKKELISQFQESFKKFTDIRFKDVGICCAGMGKKILNRQITIASIQTIVNIKEKYLGAGLIIIDEAHRIDVTGDTQYSKIIKYLRLQRPSCRILGITATPFRMGLGYCYGNRIKKGSTNLFPECNHKITYEELRDSGHLVPLKGIVAVHESMEQDLAGITVQGDYKINELSEIVCREYHLDTAVEAIEKYCPDYDCICVICVDINHAEMLHALIEDSTIVHSQLGDIERVQNMLDWENGRVRIMISVEILLEGYDLPRLKAIVFCRPTLSAALYLQAVGRVLRTCKGKDHGFILDMTSNTSYFGHDLDNVKITIPKAVEEAIKKEKGMFKLCPNCEFEVHKCLRVCPECDFAWPETECVIADRIPEMESVIFTKSPPEEKEIIAWGIEEHESKKNKKLLGKVTYQFYETDYKIGKVYMWLCFEDYYQGFAVQKAEEKWPMISKGPFPKSVDEFMESTFMTPVKMLVDMNGKFPDLISVETEPGPEPDWDGVPLPVDEYIDITPKPIQDGYKSPAMPGMTPEASYIDDVPF